MILRKTDQVKATENHSEKRRCIYCGHEAELVWVHGHGQCSHCGINTQECCQGEQCAIQNANS